MRHGNARMWEGYRTDIIKLWIWKSALTVIRFINRSYATYKLPKWLSNKESACQGRRYRKLGFDLWVGKIPEDGMTTNSSNSCLENPMDRGAWWATVHAVSKNWTRLSNWTTTRVKIHFINWLWNIYLESRHDPSLSRSLPSWPSAMTSDQLLWVKGTPLVSWWTLSREGDAQHPVCCLMLSLVLRG